MENTLGGVFLIRYHSLISSMSVRFTPTKLRIAFKDKYSFFNSA